MFIWFLDYRIKNGIYKFRLNNKDRILFVFKKNIENGKRDIVQFLRYISHDKQIVVAQNIQIDKNYINYNEKFLVENDEEILEKYVFNEEILDDIPAIVVDDKNLDEYFSKDENDFMYYLSDEQYKVLSQGNKQAIILQGAGGTGKTIVLLNKLLGINNYNRENNKKLAYITYTELLTDNVERLYRVFQKDENIGGEVDFISIKNIINVLIVFLIMRQ